MYVLEEVGQFGEPHAVIAVSGSMDKLVEFAKEVMSAYGDEISYFQREENFVLMKIGPDLFEIYPTVEV